MGATDELSASGSGWGGGLPIGGVARADDGCAGGLVLQSNGTGPGDLYEPWIRTAPVGPIDTGDPYAQGVARLVIGCYAQAFYSLLRTAVDVEGDVTTMALNAQGAANSEPGVDSTVSVLAGAVDGVTSLAGLTTAMRADARNGRAFVAVYGYPFAGIGRRVDAYETLACPTCINLFGRSQAASASSDPGGPELVSANRFRLNNTFNLYWYPERFDYKLDGRITYLIYQQEEKTHPSRDFWATSQAAGLAPMNGCRLSGLESFMNPKGNDMQPVTVAPNGDREEGNSGSLTLNADLSGEYRGAGGSAGISRTWNYSAGRVGGYSRSNNGHTVYWGSNGRPQGYPKSAEGVETWTIPNNLEVVWYVGGMARGNGCTG